jgi:iron complex transport system substrate-binding protein
MRDKFLVALFIFCSLLAGACRRENSTDNPQGVRVADADGKTVTVKDTSRVISVGTAVTETIYALGAGARVVGVDNASAEYIKESAKLPKVGARNALSAEGLLSLKPTLVVMSADAGPVQVVEQLKNSGVTVLTLPASYNVESVKNKITTLAQVFNMEARGKELNAAIDEEMAKVNQLLANVKSKPKVMFVGRGPNMPNATMSGAGTTIDEMIRLAGGANAMTGFQGFREMTDEAVVAAQPDAILITERSFERSGGTDGVLKFPGVALTPAGKNRRIIPVSDMYFQGFGPGLGRAAYELALKLHQKQ